MSVVRLAKEAIAKLDLRLLEVDMMKNLYAHQQRQMNENRMRLQLEEEALLEQKQREKEILASHKRLQRLTLQEQASAAWVAEEEKEKALEIEAKAVESALSAVPKENSDEPPSLSVANPTAAAAATTTTTATAATTTTTATTFLPSTTIVLNLPQIRKAAKMRLISQANEMKRSSVEEVEIVLPPAIPPKRKRVIPDRFNPSPNGFFIYGYADGEEEDEGKDGRGDDDNDEKASRDQDWGAPPKKPRKKRFLRIAQTTKSLVSQTTTQQKEEQKDEQKEQKQATLSQELREAHIVALRAISRPIISL